MHFAFMPYGERGSVEKLLRDMESQKHILMMYQDKEKKGIWINGQIRLLPFGVVEYIFPKESLDVVLNTLIVEENRYNIKDFMFSMLRKVLHLKKIPKYSKENKLVWIKDNVNIIPLGIREDSDYYETGGEYVGWTHEAL